MSVVHLFDREKAQSGQNSPALFDPAYRSLFGSDLEDVHRLPGGPLDWQRAGVDVVLYLTGLRQIRIDEKLRGRFGPDDVLLELGHLYPDGRKERGWLLKPLPIDFVAFGWAETGDVWLLPFLPLQFAWRRNRKLWWLLAQERRDGFRHCPAQNRGYVTHSIAVPAAVITAEVGASLRVRP